MLSRTLGGIMECLEFTVDSPEEFPDLWLPTLDISLQMDKEDQVKYPFFEKPTDPKLCLQADTHYKNVAQNCVLSYNDIMSLVSRIS